MNREGKRLIKQRYRSNNIPRFFIGVIAGIFIVYFNLPSVILQICAFYIVYMLVSRGKDFVNFEVVLPQNSKLLMFTDGLIEARSLVHDGVHFEYADMLDVFREYHAQSCDNFLNSVYGRLVEFRGTDTFDDDVCLICLDVQ